MKTILDLQPMNLQDNLVELVPLTERDFDALCTVASDPLIWAQHPAQDRYKKEVFQYFFDGALASGSTFVIYNVMSHEMMGSTRYYDYNPKESTIAIGYTFLATKYWGGAYNRATKKLLLDYAFKSVDTVRFHIGVNNIRSQKAILNIGAQKIAEVDFDLNGRQVPHYEYEIRKVDWQLNAST
jgi:RimJ/RimL family protein N-acetyltransferase